MRQEIIIKDYLRSWLKPTDGRTVKINQLDSFLEQFQDDEKNQEFTDDEKEALKQILFYHPDGIKFSTGYPKGDKEPVKLANIYFTEGGWQQTREGGNYLGSHTREGRASTHIVVTGITQSDNLNIIHPTLVIRLITALLITGEGYFISKRMSNQIISETPLEQDIPVSYNQTLIPIRSLIFSYESRRSGVNTNRAGF